MTGWKRDIRISGYFPVFEACLIGIAAGASALLLGAGINWLGSLRVFFSDRYPPQVVLPAIGLLGGLLSGCVLIVAPDTSGSGIPQVRAVLNRMSLPLNLRIAIAKLLGGTIALGSGLFMGREGPTVQVGAALAGQFSRWFPTTVEHRRYLIAAGAGAGLAAAFSAPIAGIIFVVEELLKEFKAPAVALAIVACFSAFLIEQVFGTPHKFALPDGLGEAIASWQDLLFYVLLAFAAGFLGALFNRGILLGLRVFKRFPVGKPLKVGIAGLVTGLVVALLPTSLHDYAGTRAMINAGTISGDIVPYIFGAFSLLTLLAYGSGAPGGLFAPALTIGSALGFMTAVSEQFWTGVPGSVHLFSLVGMGAFFSAVSRAPLTSIVIVFEMASDFVLVPPLMLTCVLASAVGDYFYRGGLYDLLMVWNGLNLHGPGDPGAVVESIYAKRVMEVDVQKIEAGVTVKDALEMIEASSESSLPVVKGKTLIGFFSKDLCPTDPDEQLNTLVDQVMSQPPLSVAQHDTAEDLLFLFARYKFTRLAVTDDKQQLVGMVRKEDLISAVFPQADVSP
ncbi:MAG: chloride channel protein [Candidatus Obscuribacterales bacterium]|nr:chloride channel protein [Candidatus Obscuribacterales bacterium]